MNYRYTHTDATCIAMDLTLNEIADLRNVLELALKAELEGVSKWPTRNMIKALANAQVQAADIMVYEAKLLADKAKLSDDI